MNNLDNVTAASVDMVSSSTNEEPKKLRRGFAVMDRDRVRAIAALGGTAAHAKGTAHRWNKEEAKAAGARGGVAPHKSRGGRRKPVSSSSSETSTTESTSVT